MKLISMTDFVIQKRSELMFKELGKACCKYAQFLKQPLKLEMFVPCDEDGNVLEEYKISPSEREADLYNYPRPVSIEEFNWNKAKEKVLFELNFPAAVETMNYHISRNRNIEYLANFGSIKLTQNSLNAIFG